MFKKPLDAEFWLGLFVSVEQTLFELLRTRHASVHLNRTFCISSWTNIRFARSEKNAFFGSGSIRYKTEKVSGGFFLIETKKMTEVIECVAALHRPTFPTDATLPDDCLVFHCHIAKISLIVLTRHLDQFGFLAKPFNVLCLQYFKITCGLTVGPYLELSKAY